MNNASARSMIYGYLLLLIPLGLWYRTGAIAITAASLAGVISLIVFLTVLMQDIQNGETEHERT